MAISVDIRKAGGIIIRDGKLLVARSHGKETFIMPGGKPEGDETPKQTLVRELKEELNLSIVEGDLELFGTYRATAADRPDKIVEMTVFVVKNIASEPIASAEIAELAWISAAPENITVGSIIIHDVLPALQKQGLM